MVDQIDETWADSMVCERVDQWVVRWVESSVEMMVAWMAEKLGGSTVVVKVWTMVALMALRMVVQKASLSDW